MFLQLMFQTRLDKASLYFYFNRFHFPRVVNLSRSSKTRHIDALTRLLRTVLAVGNIQNSAISLRPDWIGSTEVIGSKSVSVLAVLIHELYQVLVT